MSTPGALTTTSYAVLSLLAIKPWSTYELTRQMDRSLGRLWPRAQSKLYEEPKKLVARGLARAKTERNGRRSRTVYSITPRGRRALSQWHAEPGAGPGLEFEALLKVTFADHGTKADALASIAAARAWAVERNQENLRTARDYLAGSGPFQDRLPQNVLAGCFLTDFYRLVAQWADWATGVVARWPDDPKRAVADRGDLEEIVRRADW